MVTFNCKSVKRSVEQIRSICRFSDIVALQETWLLPHDLGFINEISADFGCFAKSSIDTTSGILRGRPYGGLALLWRKSMFSDVTVINCTSDRLAAVQINMGCRQFLILTVYLPTDSEENLVAFTDCLAGIEALIDDSSAEAIYVRWPAIRIRGVRVSAGEGGTLGGRAASLRPQRGTRQLALVGRALLAHASRRLVCRRPGAARHAPRARRHRAAPPRHRPTLRAPLVARNTRLRISRLYTGM
ncbi:unnamed protein product, partial [Brenthis ino]